MSEKSQRQRVIRGLRPLDAVAVENPAGPGTPDVNFAEGWMELKWLRQWPSRSDSIVQLPHFTLQQRRWLRRRWAVSQSAWLLLQCKRHWLLFTGDDAAEYVGRVTRQGLYDLSRSVWKTGLNDTELIRILTWRSTA